MIVDKKYINFLLSLFFVVMIVFMFLAKEMLDVIEANQHAAAAFGK